MAFNFSRLKNWLGYENITNQDLNAEFNNVIQKAGADTLSSANSTNGTAPTVAAMQTQLSPGGLGSEVLALTTQQDVQQIRYQLAAITGNPYWYQSPASSIAAINTALTSLFTVPTSRIISGRIDANSEPMFLVPSGVADTVTLKATATNFIAYINGTLRTFIADIPLSGLSVAPGVGNTALVNDASLVGQQSSATQGEFGTYITIDTVGANITALNGKYAAFKIGTEYFIAEVDTTNNRLRNASRGAGFDQTDAWNARTVISDNNTITLMNLAWIFATYNSSTAGVDVVYNKPTVAVATPTGPSVGDYWYDITNATWKKYNGTSFVGVEAVLIGYCIVDTTNVKIARSFDFFNAYNMLNTIELEFLSSTQVRATRLNQEVSVYGKTYPYQVTQPIWNVSTTLDTGVVLTANFTYYTYVTNTGDIKTSDVAPYERKYDLLGQYHPAKPWRCIGQFSTDGGSLITSASVSVTLYWQIVLPGASTSVGLGQQISASSGAFSTASAALVDVTNLSVSITTTGRPVRVAIQPDGTTNLGVFIEPGAASTLKMALFRDAVQIMTTALTEPFPPGQGTTIPGFLSFLDVVGAGTYTYKLQAASTNGAAVMKIEYVKLVAYQE